LLSNRERCQEYRNDPVLPKGHPIIWVSGYFKKELSVPASVKKLAGGKPPDGESAQNERPGTESKRLDRLIALESN